MHMPSLLKHAIPSDKFRIVQEVKTRDDTGALVTRGSRAGAQADNGPPTTLSGSGVDRFADLKFNVTRDTTFYENGAIVGSRDILDSTQGLGLGNGIFNRCALLGLVLLLSLRLFALWIPAEVWIPLVCLDAGIDPQCRREHRACGALLGWT